MINKQSDNYNSCRLINFHLPVIKSINQLIRLLDIKENESKFFFSNNRKNNLYKSFTIKKRNGSERLIEKPNPVIMPVLKAINSSIFSCFNINSHVCGFVKEKSVLDNALPHLGCKTLIKIDIKDFFPSINLKQVVYALRYYGYGKNVSKYLGYLCVNKDFTLPQGSPTSPVLSNIVCNILDSRIYGLLSKTFQLYSFEYTRYADDITISSKLKIPKQSILKVISQIYQIIREEGFAPNYDKTKWFYNGKKLLVTGIVVNNNENLYLDRKVRRKIENTIRYVRKYGWIGHISYINEKENEHFSIQSYKEHIFGLCAYYKMINKNIGRKLFEQLDKLRND